MDEASANLSRYLPGQREGHYESYFQRANHPTRPLAFWIRYTIFSPHLRPQDALGELWAIVFDGETGRHVAVKAELPIARCRFDRRGLGVRVGDAALGPEELAGEIASGGDRVRWSLSYRGGERPLFLFPLGMYEAKLPRAKSLVGVPLAVYDGTITVNDREIDVSGWVGSQNHNWGSRHTDHYAWGQVAGFDSHPGSFLEIATARLKLGSIWTPFMTPAVLRHDGREHAVNTPMQLLRSRGAFEYFSWRFSFEDEEIAAEGRIEADRGDFVGLRYANPPGGEKHCLNSKIASCRITLRHKAGAKRGQVEELATARRAAFEILTDDRGHGVAIRA